MRDFGFRISDFEIAIAHPSCRDVVSVIPKPEFKVPAGPSGDVGDVERKIRNSKFEIRNLSGEIVMKPRNLIILAVVVALFGAYIFLFERHQMTSDEARQDADKVLQGFDQDAVTSVVVDSATGRVRLEKVGEEWRLREPLDFPADSATVDSTLSSLAGLEADRRLPAEDADLSEYGLDAPVVTLTLGRAGGGETTVAVGTEMPLGSKRALRGWGGDPRQFRLVCLGPRAGDRRLALARRRDDHE